MEVPRIVKTHAYIYGVFQFTLKTTYECYNEQITSGGEMPDRAPLTYLN